MADMLIRLTDVLHKYQDFFDTPTLPPNSFDIIPVRNQILELDLVNTSITASVDAIASTGIGYTTTVNEAGVATTTVTTTSSTATPSAY